MEAGISWDRFSISNIGNSPLIISNIILPNYYSTDWKSGTINSGESKSILVRITSYNVCYTKLLRVCPKCSAAFECYRTVKLSCWCENYTVRPENLKLLADKYNNCLCPECLQLFAEKNG